VARQDSWILNIFKIQKIKDDIQNRLSPLMFISWVWRVKRVYDDTPISSPGCLYQYGIYPVGEGCQTTFFKVICDCIPRESFMVHETLYARVDFIPQAETKTLTSVDFKHQSCSINCFEADRINVRLFCCNKRGKIGNVAAQSHCWEYLFWISVKCGSVSSR
jgi:hypothetical protein